MWLNIEGHVFLGRSVEEKRIEGIILDFLAFLKLLNLITQGEITPSMGSYSRVSRVRLFSNCDLEPRTDGA